METVIIMLPSSLTAFGGCKVSKIPIEAIRPLEALHLQFEVDHSYDNLHQRNEIFLIIRVSLRKVLVTQ